MWRCWLCLFAHQHRSSGHSTTLALRWWSQATPWCRHGLTWSSWFTLWTAAARTRSDDHTASEPPLQLPPHHWLTIDPEVSFLRPPGEHSSAYLTSSWDTLVAEVFQAGSNQGIMGLINNFQLCILVDRQTFDVLFLIKTCVFMSSWCMLKRHSSTPLTLWWNEPPSTQSNYRWAKKRPPIWSNSLITS